MIILKNKTVLLLAPAFFGYENSIINELKFRGADVVFVNTNPKQYVQNIITFLTSIKHPIDKIVSAFEDIVYKKVYKSKKRFDILIVINGKYITSRIIKRIKLNLLRDDGYSVLYYWDSLSVLCDDIKRMELFDKVATFDSVDYNTNALIGCFLPLFFTDDYILSREQKAKEHDLCIIGSYKYNRYIKIKQLKEKNPNIKFFDYQYNSFWSFIPHKVLRKKYRSIRIKEIHFAKLSPTQILDVYAKSNAVLDIPISEQNGLTMRTFECLGSHKKLVTTNRNITNYDFYKPEYIYVLKNDGILPDAKWFSSNSVYWDDAVIEKYSIHNFIDNLLISGANNEHKKVMHN